MNDLMGASSSSLPYSGAIAASAAASTAGAAAQDPNAFCRQRLRQERKQWKRDHPVGFVAKPRSKPDGSVDLMTWDCKIPGKQNTPWEGASYALVMMFSEEFPAVPPKCSFTPVIFHPNIYPCGKVCLSILDSWGWSPSLNVKSILEGIQELLDNPNLRDPAQSESYSLCMYNPSKYKKEIQRREVEPRKKGFK
eukprot:gb/GECG01011993.1/.p1 GENE.gb/GECG01011993.1/~~gb/GECG01011993.1/.p1  ORF type:complete len:194 (+),score=18.20 gb/GECG01011993.1/:1-582(+)